MATLISTQSWGQMLERIKKYLSNNWPDIADSYTDNELALYAFEGVAEAMVQHAELKYKLEGVYPDQEGFITRYTFAASAISQDIISQVYSLTLPLPPVNLPLGVSIKSPFWTGFNAPSFPWIAVHAYQRGYNFELPTPDFGTFYYVEGNTLYIDIRNALVDLQNSGWTANIPMLSARPRTGSDDDLINLPDDEMSIAFDMIIQKLVARVNRPRTQANTGAPRLTEAP